MYIIFLHSYVVVLLVVLFVLLFDLGFFLFYWASEASSTLGCSIEISRDIYNMLSVCRMSVVCQINCVGGITWPTRMLKVILGR